MIAKISNGHNIIGVLLYNQLKVRKDVASVLFANKVIESPDGAFMISNIVRSFQPYLVANRRTEKQVLHISLNPDPKDLVSDVVFRKLASQYMNEMGYGDQPYIVFKHTDIDRTHIHIVSVCVDQDGRKIGDKFNHRRSMTICRKLEEMHGLTVANLVCNRVHDRRYNPVNYIAGDVKSQIAAVVRSLPKSYSFQSLGGYNALLSLFNITAEEVRGEYEGVPRSGLVYFALDENRRKVTNPFKSSLFGKVAGYDHIQSVYRKAKANLKTSSQRELIHKVINEGIGLHRTENALKEFLFKQGIDIVVRRNDENRIYGITFVDHNSKSVWKGSDLSKSLSANEFNRLWACEYEPPASLDLNNIKPIAHKIEVPVPDKSGLMLPSIEPLGELPLFNFADFDGLLPLANYVGYEEEAFADQFRKRKRKKKKR